MVTTVPDWVIFVRHQWSGVPQGGGLGELHFGDDSNFTSAGGTGEKFLQFLCLYCSQKVLFLLGSFKNWKN